MFIGLKIPGKDTSQLFHKVTYIFDQDAGTWTSVANNYPNASKENILKVAR